ncbi:hypothetical protein Vretifemale_2123 [Volvox reticuliferus]|nr:hypothetical protein Vretifemale_2123 [Volvox reticuliferus]
MNDAFEDGGFTGAPCVAAYIDSETEFKYNTNDRHRRDTAWTVAYCLLAALTLAGSIPVFLRTDPNTGLYSNRFFNNSTSCDVRRYQQVAGMYNDSTYDPTFLRRFKAEAIIWIPATAGLSLLWSALYLLLFCLVTRTILGMEILGSLLLGTGLSAMCFTIVRSLPLGVTLAAGTAVATGFLLFVGRWARVFSELLTAAAQSLRKNPWLVPTTLGMKIAGLLVLAYGFSALFSAVNHGFVSRNWDAVQRYAVAEENGFCLNAAKKHGGLVMQLRTFATADTLTQWYFSSGAGSAAALLAPLRAIHWTSQGLRRTKYIGRAANCILRPIVSATVIRASAVLGKDEIQ